MRSFSCNNARYGVSHLTMGISRFRRALRQGGSRWASVQRMACPSASAIPCVIRRRLGNVTHNDRGASCPRQASAPWARTERLRRPWLHPRTHWSVSHAGDTWMRSDKAVRGTMASLMAGRAGCGASAMVLRRASDMHLTSALLRSGSCNTQ